MINQINVGVIGTGWCGGIRANACYASPLVDKLYIAEKNPDRLKELASKLEVEGSTNDWINLIQNPDIDTIIISAIQFSIKILVVNDEMLESEEILIPLEKFVNKLSEVIVRPHNLSGDLFKDFENSGVKPINFYNRGIPGFTGTRKEKIVTKKQLIISALLFPLTGSIPIDPIYKHISGYYKVLKKKRKLDVEFDIIENLIKFYGLDYFIETFDVSEDEVYEFVSGTYINYPLRETFNRNEHNKVMKYFEQNKLRVLNNIR